MSRVAVGLRAASPTRRRNSGVAEEAIVIVATVGVVAVGAALIEVALLPGLAIGAAAALAPRAFSALTKRPVSRSAPAPRRPSGGPAPRRGSTTLASTKSILARLEVNKAIAKTITFRLVVTTLDFSANYIVLGQLGTAAGLSAIGLVAAPLLYFAHEAGWSHYGPALAVGSGEGALPSDGAPMRVRLVGFVMSRTLAKTITFRIIATIMDFGVTYAVVGDAATAALLSSFGFVIGPFVYYGHEWLWDRLSAQSSAAPDAGLAAQA